MSDDNKEILPNGLKELPLDTNDNDSDSNTNSERNPIDAAESPDSRIIAGNAGLPSPNGAGDARVCGAKTRSGTPCKRLCTPGRPRCRLHGGLTPYGINHYKYKTGQRSKYLKDIPPALKKGYQAALKDDTLHSLDADLALLQARMGQLLSDLSATEAPPWGKVVDALVNFEQARRGKDKVKAKRCFAELAHAIRQGSDAAREHERIWADIFDTINLKSRAAAQEHKRQVDLSTLVPAETTLALLRATMERTKRVLEDRLDDPKQASKMMAEIARSIAELLPGPTATVIENQVD